MLSLVLHLACPWASYGPSAGSQFIQGLSIVGAALMSKYCDLSLLWIEQIKVLLDLQTPCCSGGLHCCHCSSGCIFRLFMKFTSFCRTNLTCFAGSSQILLADNPVFVFTSIHIMLLNSVTLFLFLLLWRRNNLFLDKDQTVLKYEDLSAFMVPEIFHSFYYT